MGMVVNLKTGVLFSLFDFHDLRLIARLAAGRELVKGHFFQGPRPRDNRLNELQSVLPTPISWSTAFSWSVPQLIAQML